MNNRFIIIIGSYNNARWVDSNLDSVLAQDYQNYMVRYFDDASTDNTGRLASEKVGDNPRFKVESVMSRKYKTWFFSQLTDIQDNDILVFLDGDDMFYAENVLSYLNEVYNKSGCWMTYGGMLVWMGDEKIVEPFPQNSTIPAEVIDGKLYRKDTWRTSHLKTMRGFLWKSFDKGDLCPNGTYMVGPDDLAIMFGMLELCPPEKVYRVTEPIYLYNHSDENGGSRAHTEQIKLNYEGLVRSRKPYNTLGVVSPTLAGGLGNQMFEIAAAASLAKDNNAILIVNPNEHICPNQGNNVNTYTTNIFSKIALDSNPPLKVGYTWDKPTYSQIPFAPNLKLRGHFQSYKYFDHNRDYIKELFWNKGVVSNEIDCHYHMTSTTTAIQVRRGDYIKFPDHHPMLTAEYYKKAVEQCEHDQIYICSDDIEWCKENLQFSCPVQYIKDRDYAEMYLIASCKNIIISNSSFGWWSAYLKRHEYGKIIAPSTWFGPALLADGFNLDDLLPPNWLRI